MHFNGQALEKFLVHYPVKDFDKNKIRFLRTTFQFDEKYTFKILSPGNTPEKYYQYISCLNHLHKIDVPVLFLHSKNDSLCL